MAAGKKYTLPGTTLSVTAVPVVGAVAVGALYDTGRMRIVITHAYVTSMGSWVNAEVRW